MSITSLLTQAALFTQTAAHHDPLRQALAASGYTPALHDEGERAVAQAQHALDHIAELPHADKLAHHLTHTAATELDMWLQTAHLRAEKSLAPQDPRLLHLCDTHLHGPSHTITSLAQTLRFNTTLRLDPQLRTQLQAAFPLADLLQRGKVLAEKTTRIADEAAAPQGVTTTLQPHLHTLQTWLTKVQPLAAKALAAEPFLLGLLGHVPDGLGAPLGGTATSVTLHERSHRDAPTGGPSAPDPGWSVGRQGRNNQNTGRGFV